MTSANMLSRVRTLLDESSASFFSDSEIYSALADGQRELFTIALLVRKNGELPEILRPCVATAQGTISIGQSTVNISGLTNFADIINVSYNSASSSTLYPALRRELTEKTPAEKNNTYLVGTAGKDFYYSVSATQIVFETAATGTAGYSITYLSTPSDIASGTQPTLPDFSHNAIVQYAFAFILRKDQREQEAQVEFAKFNEMVKEIML